MGKTRLIATGALTIGLLLAWPPQPLRFGGDGAAAEGGAGLHLYVGGISSFRLTSADASTLADSPSARPFKLGPVGSRRPDLFTNSEGWAVAAVTYGLASIPGPKHGTTIRMFDASGRKLEPAFHPGTAMVVEGLSPNAAELYGRGYSGALDTGFYVLSARTGRVRYHLSTSKLCCGPSIYDAAGHRMYVLNEPTKQTAESPGTPILNTYDLITGRQTGRLALQGVLAGGWEVTDGTSSSSDPLYMTWGPGFALSPDGAQIAILDGSKDLLTTVDTKTMTVQRAVSLSRPQSLLGQIAAFVGLAPATAEAKGFRGVSLRMMYSPDGQSLVVSGFQGMPDSQGLYFPSPLGLRRIDVATGKILTETQPVDTGWLQYAPDGSALFGVVYPPSDHTYAGLLERFDPSTLSVQASRSLNQDYFSPPAVILSGS
jgi:hypothetical protein